MSTSAARPEPWSVLSGGVAGGVRAIEHLAQIVVEEEMVPLRNTVLVSRVQTYFHENAARDPLSDASLGIVLDDLSWWGNALRQARAAGELPPGSARLRAAMAAQATGRN